MARVDFLISNDRHHRAMTWPVAEALADHGGVRSRILSLCELRGVRSPEEPPRGAELQRVVPFHLRRSPSVGRSARAVGPGAGRRALRSATWRLLLAPRLAALLSERPDLVVLPNDAAFPYDRVAARLRFHDLPFLLLQEGIRFPLPAEAAGPSYGTGGAEAIAAWGAGSGEYFLRVGVAAERIHLTGSPRFDLLQPPASERERRRFRAALGLPPRTVALISNPIDDQGFCTHHEKMELFGRFLREVEPLFDDPEIHLAVKLHGRESATDFQSRIPPALGDRVSVHTAVDLAGLLFACRAAIVMASSVGLEALLCGLPLAVLELPGHGFQYDYVQSGAAVGLAWNTPMAPQVVSLLEPSEERRSHVERYLQRQFANRGEAGRRVAQLILTLLAGQR